MRRRLAARRLVLAWAAGSSWAAAVAEQATFTCAGDSRRIPGTAVNDNYCDCHDGSDEPGTGACAGRDHPHFLCENFPSSPRYLYLSRVGDGICDCCDGTDEGVAATGRPDLCPNSCEAEALVLRRHRAERRQLVQDGLAAQQAAQNESERKVAAWRAELEEIQKNLTDLTRERDEAKAREKSVRAQKDEEDAAAARAEAAASTTAAAPDGRAPYAEDVEDLEIPRFEDDFEVTEAFEAHWSVAEGGSARQVDDPKQQRGRVLAFSSCTWGGDVFSRDGFRCSSASKCRISFWARGAPWQGLSVAAKRTTEPSDAHSWLAVPGANVEFADRLLTTQVSDAWAHYEYELPRADDFQMFGSSGVSFASSKVHIMLQAHASTGQCADTMFDDIRLFSGDSVKFKDKDGDEVEFSLNAEGKFQVSSNGESISQDVGDLRSSDGGMKLHFRDFKVKVPDGGLPLAQKALDIFTRRSVGGAPAAPDADGDDDPHDLRPQQAEGAAAAKQKEEPEVSEYAKWALNQDGKASPPEEDEDEGDLPYNAGMDDEEGGYDPEDEEDYDKYDEDIGDVNESTAEGRLKIAEHAARKADGKVRSAERSKRDLQDKLRHVDKNDARFLPMVDACVQKYIDKYVYKVCFFGTAKQGSTRLGSFKNLSSPSESGVSLHFADGDVCWQGPARSLKVRLTCGVKPEILEITEPSQCVYEAEVVHPCGCTESMLEGLAEHGQPVILPHQSPHQEL